jgi:succinylarginine dihydrolase
MKTQDVNFDGLVGLTHNYSGVVKGDVGAANKDQIARPRQAALENLNKMRGLMNLGLRQGVLPPHERPAVGFLRDLGFSGSDHRIWEKAWTQAPRYARAAAASASMWASNSATTSPSANCGDGLLHISIANLNAALHRSIEAEASERVVRRIFADETTFRVHGPLPAHASFSDEGGANHLRLSAGKGAQGLEIFVHGRGERPRHTLEASQAIARRHGLDPARVIFTSLSEAAQKAGAMYSDLVAVAHENVLLSHAEAFHNPETLKAEIRDKARGLFEPVLIEITPEEVSLADAVKTCFFNAQMLRFPYASRLSFVAPREVRENNQTADLAADLRRRSGGIIDAPMFAEVYQSMRAGGGPSSMALSFEMTAEEAAAVQAGFFLTPKLSDALEDWISTHYRAELSPADLSDPLLIDETRKALDELTRILPLGTDFYPFQRV